MPDLPALLDELVAFSRHLRAERKALHRGDLRRLEYFHQMLAYHVIYGSRDPTPVVERSSKQTDLVARRCSIEGCQGGPALWNIAVGRLNGQIVWRCLAHIPPDINYPVALHGAEWKATGRK